MTIASKYINIDSNLLLEWNYNDTNILVEDYLIVQDTRTTLNYFVNNLSNGSESNNGLIDQLFPYTESLYLWDIMNPTKYNFLSQKLYGTPPITYDRLRVHLPMGYTLADKVGFLLRLQLDGNDGQKYTISNNFYDKSNPSRLTLNPRPFLYNGRQWGSYIEFMVPNGNAISNQLVYSQGSTSVLPGSINYNLTSGSGISRSMPWRLLFYWLTDNNTIDGPLYKVIPSTSWAVPYQPTYKELSVVFRDAIDNGDYYEIYCTYNGSQSGFVDFMTNQSNLGINNQLQFEIQQIEGGIITDSQRKVLQFGDSWDTITTYRPIFKSTATVIEVYITATLTNLNDGTSETRTTSRIFLDSEVSRYGINLSGISVKNLQQVRVYQNKKDNSTALGQDIDFIDILSFDEWGNFYSDQNAFLSDDPDVVAKARSQKKLNGNGISTIKISTPVLVDKYHISTMSSNQTLANDIWYGNGLLEILIYPSDNIISFDFASVVSSTISPFELPSGDYYMIFARTIEIPLYKQAGTINLKGGKLLFRISLNQELSCEKLYSQGFNQFIIVLRTPLGGDTTLYGGSFIPYNSDTFRSRQQKNINSSLNGQTPIGATPAGITTPTITVSLQDSTSQFIAPIPNTKNC